MGSALVISTVFDASIFPSYVSLTSVGSLTVLPSKSLLLSLIFDTWLFSEVTSSAVTDAWLVIKPLFTSASTTVYVAV